MQLIDFDDVGASPPVEHSSHNGVIPPRNDVGDLLMPDTSQIFAEDHHKLKNESAMPPVTVQDLLS